jgi:hypothetical protein
LKPIFVFLLFFGSISPGARIRLRRALPSPPGEGPSAEDKCQRVVLPLAVDVIVVVFFERAMRKIDTRIRRERRCFPRSTESLQKSMLDARSAWHRPK